MLRVLHVSDVHFGFGDKLGDQNRIADALIEAAHGDGSTPDVCIFSGDLAQSGDARQFTRGEDWLTALLAPWKKTSLFVVPGNHDVDRRKAKPALLRSIASGPESYHDWREEPGIGHLAGFLDWHAAASTRLPLKGVWETPLGYHSKLTVESIPVHIIGLNSALFSCNDEDPGKLCLDVKLINDSLRKCKDHPGLVIAVAHHPLEQLAHWNREEVERTLSQETGAHLFFHGHLHDQMGRFQAASTGARLGILGAGAAYQGSSWPHGFAFYEIDFNRRELRTRAYSYSRNAGEWIFEAERSRTVVMNIPLIRMPHSPKKRRSSAKPKSSAGQQAADADRDVATTASKKQISRDLTELQVYKYREAASLVRDQLMGFLAAAESIKGVCYAQASRVKGKDRILEKMEVNRLPGPEELVDICGIRLVTHFPSEIALVLSEMLGEIDKGYRLPNFFRRDKPIEVRIHSSRHENDPLSISKDVREVAARYPLKIDVHERSHRTGYSSVHLIVWVVTSGDHGVQDMRVEFQIRSALEEL
jgi:ppGpp synthetase/RelA/SpoT-type nucleotidyltranferase/predicted MPP superfamily phosphohydrolase